MSSERLPGKVLREVNGKPLLGYLLNRLEKIKNLDGVVVATSTSESDQEIVRYCKKNKVECYQGPLQNVAARFLGTLRIYQMDAFVRISADSPLLDPDLIDHSVTIFKSSDYDFVTNVLKRTFPKGQSVEVVRAGTFMKYYPRIQSQQDREHVTTYFYRNARQFKILNLPSPDPGYSKINLSIDTKEDLNRFILILGQMRRPFSSYGWKEIVEIYEGLLVAQSACLN